jgi:photosystem II stability/assembly factor-like uncharacterized protein
MTDRPHILAALAALGLALTGCGGGAQSTSAPTTPSTPTAATTTAATAPAPSTATTPAAADTTGARAPAGGPVPAGFDPVAFTAISPRQFWLLGSAPCSHPVCTSIVRSTDGGAHFVGIPAPIAPVSTPNSGPGIAALLFADPLDGFAGGSGYPEPRPLYETHDGGAHWRRGRSDLIAFTISAGHVDAVTGSCAKGICSQLRLARSPATTDNWTSIALPVVSAAGVPTLTASGNSIYVSLTPTTGTPSHQALLVSRDGGASVTRTTSPCYSGLAGRLEASSATVAWAVCPTGMEAGAWRTTDAGAHWSAIRATASSGGLANSAQLAPASDSTALLEPGGNTRLLRTTDAGHSFTQLAFPAPGASVEWFGFTDPRTGSALLTGSGAPVGPDQLPPAALWRSSNGGVQWRALRIAGA